MRYHPLTNSLLYKNRYANYTVNEQYKLDFCRTVKNLLHKSLFREKFTIDFFTKKYLYLCKEIKGKFRIV